MIYELRNLLADNKFDEVISKLLIMSYTNKNDEMNRSVLLMKGRLTELRRANIRGIVTYEDGTVTRNVIRSEFFNLTDIYADDIKKFSAPPPPKIYTYADFGEILSELAHELASNYFIASFGDEKQGVHKRPNWQDIFNPTAQFKEINKKRNILIVGAGATYAACPYMPYGKQLRAYLLDSNHKELYQKGDETYNRLFPKYDVEAYLSEQTDLKSDEQTLALLRHHLTQTHNKIFNVENYLSVLDSELAEADKPKLRADLQHIYNKRHLPTHTYEIIAHLFKHRFIDIIINFNFDELLDQAIEEELGKSDYYRILHEGDCEALNNIMIDGRLKTPVYIKIHGTASVMNSMQFTQNHRLRLPVQMQYFIQKWVRGQVSDDENQGKIPVNLIALGFDLERAQFSEELRTLKEGSKLFQINWKSDSASRIEHLKPHYEKKQDGKIQKRHVKLADWDKIGIEERKSPLIPMADFWTRLWEKHILPLFKPLFKPRSIARHQIVADIFYDGFKRESHDLYKNDLQLLKSDNERFNRYFSSSAYFFERTAVEVAITLANNKGIIEPLEAIKQDRIGTFYNEYKKKLSEDLNFLKLQPLKQIPFVNTRPYCKELYTLKHICINFFKMEQKFSFSNHLFNLSIFPNEEEGREGINFDFLQHFISKKLDDDKLATSFLNDSKNLHFLLAYRLYQAIQYLLGAEDEKYLLPRLFDALNEIRTGFSYNITPKFRDHTVHAFESARRRDILHTGLALSYQFETVFSDPNKWDILLLISERGNFLAKHIDNLLTNNKIKSKPIILIGCHEAIAEDLHQPELYDTMPTVMEQLSKAYLKDKKLEEYKQLKLYFLPYWRHHHHVAIFLKIKPQNTLNRKRAYFEDKTSHQFLEVVKSIYYFKQGFSNKINPLLVPTEADTSIEAVKADQAALMDKFIAHYMKAVYFGANGDSIAVVKPDLSFKYESQNIDYTKTKDDFFKYLVTLHLKK